LFTLCLLLAAVRAEDGVPVPPPEEEISTQEPPVVEEAISKPPELNVTEEPTPPLEEETLAQEPPVEEKAQEEKITEEVAEKPLPTEEKIEETPTITDDGFNFEVEEDKTNDFPVTIVTFEELKKQEDEANENKAKELQESLQEAAVA
jgi:hypothetical protein